MLNVCVLCVYRILEEGTVRMEHLESRKDLGRGGARREKLEWFMLWYMGDGTDQTLTERG